MFAYTWKDFDTDVRWLVDAVTACPRPISSIYGIPRGGLVPAVYLSHALNRPLLLGDLAAEKLSDAVLVVDDNTVTGGELAAYAARGCLTAVLVHNPLGSKVTPRFYGRESLDWPVFPWEVGSGVKL